jgi:hypothetical protein
MSMSVSGIYGRLVRDNPHHGRQGWPDGHVRTERMPGGRFGRHAIPILKLCELPAALAAQQSSEEKLSHKHI